MNLEMYRSVNQTHRNPHTTTEAYKFIPTTRVLNVLADHGWQPKRVTESGIRNELFRGYQRHMVELENEQYSKGLDVGGVTPRIVLTNDHKGGSSCSLFAGLFELICCNGLVVKRESWKEHRIPHIGFADWKVSLAVKDIIRQVPQVLETRDKWRSIKLDSPQMVSFVERAIPLRFDSKVEVRPHNLLFFRPGQDDFSLWSVFNTVQERLIMGGIEYEREDGRTAYSRPVNAIDATVRINRDLWALAEKTAAALN
jgi:hypothetical protein